MKRKRGPKLTQDDRDWIVWQYNEGLATQEQLAEYFDVTRNYISYLVVRRRNMDAMKKYGRPWEHERSI